MHTENLMPYLAGFFDGEGCVCFSRSRSRPGSRLFRRIQVSAGQADNRQPLDFLRQAFGGSISSRRLKSGKTFFEWRLNSYHGVQRMYRELAPLLLVKREQFERKLEQYRAN